MRIAVFGLGYVGATSMACLTSLGHSAVGVDIDEAKLRLVGDGLSPIQEPKVADLLGAAYRAGAVSATRDVADAVSRSDACFVCVGTPSRRNGTIDTRFLYEVVDAIAAARLACGRCVPVFVRSTALPSVHRELIERLRVRLDGRQPLAYCVHPEFLREGQAVADFFEPPKIVFGCTDASAERACRELYPGIEAPTVFADPDVAALVKYADNCFHAVKVTFANEVGQLAQSFGVDARAVMDVFCLDTKLNISSKYLRPGLPYGGSCLPKDLRGVVSWARQEAVSMPMLEHVSISNDAQIQHIVSHILHSERQRIGMIGLAFKNDTDDLRESPMVAMAEHLLGKGRSLRVYDNNLIPERLIGTNRRFALDSLPHLSSMLVEDCAELVAESDLVVLARQCAPGPLRDLPWRRGQLMLDLAGLSDYDGIPADVVGLYWPGSPGQVRAVSAIR